VPSNTVRGPRKPCAPSRAAWMPTCAAQPACRRLVHAPSARYSMMPLAMLPACPMHPRLPAVSFRVRATASVRPSAEHGGRVKAGLVDRFRDHHRHPAQRLDAGHKTGQCIAAVAAEAFRRRQHRRHDHRARMHRTAFEGVVEVLAVRRRAVDQRRRLGRKCLAMADCRTGPAGIDTAITASRNRCCGRPRTALPRRSAVPRRAYARRRQLFGTQRGGLVGEVFGYGGFRQICGHRLIRHSAKENGVRTPLFAAARFPASGNAAQRRPWRRLPSDAPHLFGKAVEELGQFRRLHVAVLELLVFEVLRHVGSWSGARTVFVIRHHVGAKPGGIHDAAHLRHHGML